MGSQLIMSLYYSIYVPITPPSRFGMYYATAETWSRFWGDGVGALAPKNFFLPSPQIAKFGGHGGGLTVS